MKKKAIKSKGTIVPHQQIKARYDCILSDISDLLEYARHASARKINSVITDTYWKIGRRIVLYEQDGFHKAEYGHGLLKQLGNDLTRQYGRGFGWRNLFEMRSFYLAYPEKLQTVSAKFTVYKSTASETNVKK